MTERVWVEWSRGYVHALAAFPEAPCYRCGHLTAWVDLDFEVRLCPGGCAEATWLDYSYARQTGAGCFPA